MRRFVFVLTALLLSRITVAQDRAGGDGVTAFEHVNVLTMDSESILDDRTVIVRGGTIADIFPSGTKSVPDGAARINGSGHYLMPGLADMHIHPYTVDEFPAYLAHGVTTVLELSATAETLQWRDQIANGAMAGPTVYAGRFLNGPGEVEYAVQVVRDAVNEGYDYIKVYNDLTGDQFSAVMNEAKRLGIAVVGHAVRAPGMQGLLDAGQRMIVHAEEYLYTVFSDQSSEAQVDSAIAMTLRAGAYVTPNLSAYEVISLQWGRPAVIDSFLAMPQSSFLPPRLRASWRNSDYVGRRGSLGKRLIFLRGFTGRLHEAGVPLLLGTDAPDIPGMYPGYSIHMDIRNMLQAGLSEYDVLSAGTRVAGEFVGATVPGAESFGVIRSGMRADLLLLDGNPLVDIGVVVRPAGVMARGRWYPRAVLDEKLAALGRRFVPLHDVVDDVAELLQRDEVEAALQRLSNPAARQELAGMVESAVNRRGYRYLQAGDVGSALRVFRLNTRYFPYAFNTWDSLGEVYMLRGDRQEAIESYKKSLALNPDNTNAVEMLRRLNEASSSTD